MQDTPQTRRPQSVARQEPNTHAQQPLPQEPHILPHEPYDQAKEPYDQAKEPNTHAPAVQRAGTESDEPELEKKEFRIVTRNECLAGEPTAVHELTNHELFTCHELFALPQSPAHSDARLKSLGPCILPQESYDRAKEPYNRAKEPHDRGNEPDDRAKQRDIHVTAAKRSAGAESEESELEEVEFEIIAQDDGALLPLPPHAHRHHPSDTASNESPSLQMRESQSLDGNEARTSQMSESRRASDAYDCYDAGPTVEDVKILSEERGVLQCVQHVAVSGSVLLCVAVCCRAMQCLAVCCGVLQCVAVCCS